MHVVHLGLRNLLAALASPWTALDEVLDGRVREAKEIGA